jgi:hypothetical protein
VTPDEGTTDPNPPADEPTEAEAADVTVEASADDATDSTTQEGEVGDAEESGNPSESAPDETSELGTTVIFPAPDDPSSEPGAGDAADQEAIVEEASEDTSAEPSDTPVPTARSSA